MRERAIRSPHPLERERSAGPVVLGRSFWLHWRWIGVQTAVALICFLAIVVGFDHLIMADGSGGADLGALTNTLQQMIQEQQHQRQQIESLSQAVQGTGNAVQNTQIVTEQVVHEVVTQVQAGFQQEQQQSHDQLVQVGTILTTLQEQMQQMGQALQQVQQQQVQLAPPVSGAASASGASPPGYQSPGGQSPVHNPPPVPAGPSTAAGQVAGGVTPNGVGNVGGPQVFNIGGAGNIGGPGFGGVGPGGIRTSPAVAYAIQQGGVDSKQLGKPGLFNPTDGKSSFLDWADSIITLSDSNMPGIYEVLEWIATSQQKTPMTQGDVLLHFPHLDPLLVQYADTNVYAMLTTYTLGEARSLVRQARRPNGFEAFRLLQIRFNPVTIGRQRADLMKITNPSAAISIDRLAAELVSWENLIVQYESRPGADRVSDAMKMAALVHIVPNALKQHLHMNAARYTTYLELREEVMSYIEQVAPVASTTMDVGSVGLSKGGGCYNCGGPHMQKDCKKGKGKGGKEGGKGKGKIPDGGKGKGKGKGFEGKKGGGKAKPVCYNCGKTGHYKDQCWSRPKPLNAVDKETSPLLSQLQSSYAKAAVEEFQRLRLTGASSSSAPSPPVVQVSTPSSPTSPGAASSAAPKHPVSAGSLTIKHLCALSRA